MRIVSLVPSLTQTICDFGLRDHLVGCTSFCVKPPGLQRQATLIGGTKDPDLTKIRLLQPSHILVNEEENKPEHIRICRDIAPTLVSFPKSPREVPALLREMGDFLGNKTKGLASADLCSLALDRLDRAVTTVKPPPRKYLYFIWREPYMLAGEDSYISAMLGLVNLHNVAPTHTRYPEIVLDQARLLNPDLLLLSTEPYPFRARDAARLHAEWPETPAILRVDGQRLSWYGTETTEALQGLEDWILGRPQELARPFR